MMSFTTLLASHEAPKGECFSTPHSQGRQAVARQVPRFTAGVIDYLIQYNHSRPSIKIKINFGPYPQVYPQVANFVCARESIRFTGVRWLRTQQI